MRDVEEEELDVQRRFPRLSMRSKILLLAAPFILCALFLSVTAGPFLMDLIVEAANLVEDNSSEPSDSEFYLAILEDDFDYLNPHWTEYMMGTGTRSFSNGTLLLTVNNESSAEMLSVSGLYDYTGGYHLETDVDTTMMPWLYKAMEVRLRCSNDNKMASSVGGGTRWWGFFDFVSGREPFKKNALCFKSGSPECEERDIGFTVESWVDGVVVFRENLTGIDMRDWHNYTIIWNVDKATFKVDGEVVAIAEGAGMVPDEPMPMYIQICNIIYCSEPWDWMPLVDDQSIEIDYVHLYYADEEVSQNESEYISELFSNASRIIEGVESRGYDAREMKGHYSRAEDNWKKYYYYTTIESLEAIMSSVDKYDVADEIIQEELFELAKKAISEAEEEGNDRNMLFLNNQLRVAENCWEKQDYTCAKTYLEKIINSVTNRS